MYIQVRRISCDRLGLDCGKYPNPQGGMRCEEETTDCGAGGAGSFRIWKFRPPFRAFVFQIEIRLDQNGANQDPVPKRHPHLSLPGCSSFDRTGLVLSSDKARRFKNRLELPILSISLGSHASTRGPKCGTRIDSTK